MNVNEGLPLVAARIGSRAGERFALDLGSTAVLLTGDFVGEGAARDMLGFTGWVTPTERSGFLEGPVLIRTGRFGSLTFGGEAFMGRNEFWVEQPENDMLELPFDGIIGTAVLRHFDLWFDYSGAMLYARFVN